MNLGSEVVGDLGRLDDSAAVVDRRGRITTFAQLQRLAESFARIAKGNELGPGDRVLLEVPPGVQMVSTAAALMSTGAVPAFIEPGHGDDVYLHQVKTLDPRCRVTGNAVRVAQTSKRLREALARRGILVPPPTAVPHIRTALGRGQTADGADLDEGAPGLSITTGGTTGSPAHVVHTHRSLAAILQRIGLIIGDARDIGVDTAAQILGAIALGATAHLIGGNGPRRSMRLAGLIEKGSIDTYFGSPSTWAPILATGFAAGPELRHVILGGAPVTKYFLSGLVDAVLPSTRVTVVYGLTEHGPVTSVDGRDKLAYTGDGDLVGVPLPGLEVTIEDEEVVVDGQKTGDVGDLISDAGRIHLVLKGRSKTMIIRGGVNIYPELIEPIALEALRKTTEIREIALVGTSSSDAGEEQIVCWYAPNTDENRVRKTVEQALGPKNSPDQYRPCDSLPRVGRQQKLDRNLMRSESAP